METEKEEKTTEVVLSFHNLKNLPPLYPSKNKMSAPAAASYFRITLHRSAIGLPHRTHKVLTALGLHKRGKTVFHPVHPQFAGMIMKVKELVQVEEVPHKLTAQEIRAERRPDPGFWVEKRAGR